MKILNISLNLSFLLIIGLVSFAQAQNRYSGDSWAKVQEQGSGTLGVVYYEVTGMIEKKSDGEFEGVCVDILNDFKSFVKDKYGKNVNIKYLGQEKVFYDFLKQSLYPSYVIGVSSVSITPERQKTMKFTPPFMRNSLVMVTNKGAADITNFSDMQAKLSGYKGLAIRGGNNVKYINYVKENHFPSLKMEFRTSEKEILKEISEQGKAFSILDFTDYIYAFKNKLLIKKHNVNLSQFEEDFGFALSANSDWGQLWDEFLTLEYKSSSKYKQIIHNNLGASFTRFVD